MKLKLNRGTASKIVRVPIGDTTKTSTDGGLTGLVSNSSGLICYYIREGDTAATAVTLASTTVGAYVSGGFVEVDPAHMPGLYELGLPAAALASGNSVVVYLIGAANQFPVRIEIELDAINYQDGVHAGLAALPNAAATAAGGLLTVGTGTGQINPNGSGKVPATLAAADVAGNLPANLTQWLGSAPNALQSGRVDAYAGATASSLTFNLTGNVTGNLSGSVGSVTGSVGSIAGVTFPANFGALGITVAGKVGEVALVDTLTTYTGNTPQTGDLFAVVNPMVAGHVFTTASLANAPTGGGGSFPGAAPANWLTSSAFAAGVLPINFGSLGITAAGKVSEVALTDTVTAVTNPMTTGSPAAGVTVIGSTNVSVTLSGLPAGKTYAVTGGANNQRLLHGPSGEARIIATQAVSGGNYIFTFGTGSVGAGPFSANPAAGDLFYPLP